MSSLTPPSGKWSSSAPIKSQKPTITTVFFPTVGPNWLSEQPAPTMTTHRINAANNGFHWTIAFDKHGDVAEINVCVSNDLYRLFECDCGAEFDTKPAAIAHLNEISNDDSGERVKHFSFKTSTGTMNQETQP